MNIIPKAWSRLKTDPHLTELKGKFHRLSHQSGLMELSFALTAQQREEFDAKSKQLLARRQTTIDDASQKASEIIKAAKREAELANDKAHSDYEAAIFGLFLEYGKIPSREQIAISETKVDHVVIAPAEAEATT